jgi:hypothetical protein
MVFINEVKGDLKLFDKLCKERGVIPPFARMREWKGYEKLVTDRRIWDKNGKFIEQKPLTFKFDMPTIMQMMKDYKGLPKTPADQTVVDEFVANPQKGSLQGLIKVERKKKTKAAVPEPAKDTLTQMKEAATKKLSFKEKIDKEKDLAKTSGNTATARGVSAPAKAWAEAGYIEGKSVFDWGAGLGADLPFYEEAGAKSVKGYDPNHMPEKPAGSADVVASTYVANVLPPALRQSHLIEAYGRATEALLVTVRNEVPEGTPYEDGVLVKLKGAENFQKAFTQDELIEYLQKLFPGATVKAGPRLSGGVTAVVEKKRNTKNPGTARRDKTPIK